MSDDEARRVLADLVRELNAYNARDMLAGYLDQLAADFNARLEGMGLLTIESYGPHD